MEESNGLMDKTVKNEKDGVECGGVCVYGKMTDIERKEWWLIIDECREICPFAIKPRTSNQKD